MSKAAQVKAPWLNSRDPGVPATLTYSELSMCGRVEEMVRRYPDYIAYEFMGKCTTYADMWKKINACAKSLKAIGIREGDKVTICMPNAPQTLCMFYAVNMVGAIANMVHPLSAESEIAFYLRDSGSVAAITLDQFYPKFESVRKAVDLPCLIVTSVADELKPLLKVGYKLTEGRKNPKIPAGRAGVLSWKEFLRRGEYVEIYQVRRKAEDPAAILYSGGTTGVTKGILLSNRNFNALAAQIIATNPFFRPGHKMLAIMPMFHGFGLGVSIHSMVANGGHCILIPRFTPQSYAELIKKHKPNLIAGVPSLFEALLRVKEIEGADLSCLLGVFSGGDSLSVELKKRFDAFLKEHGASITVREGYGTTECVTASCLTPIHKQKEGSIGIPFPDTYYKIVKPGTQEEVPYGEEGEICLTGPTMMLEYVNHPEETAQTKQTHADGLTWVHTGDLGMMDEEGFIYFRQRIKRMIVTNGYNVYPSQLENILDGHEYVHLSCVIGVKDPIKMQRVKAFVVLKPGYVPTEACKQELMDYCRKHIAKYAMPSDIEFREELPKTLVGKVAYRVLEEEENAKLDAKAAENAKIDAQRRQLEEERKAAVQERKAKKWNTVLSASEVKEYPQDDLDTAKTEFRTLYENYAKQADMTLEDFVKAQGISMDDFEEQSGQYAEYKVKQNLIVQGIMDAEKMTLEDKKSLSVQDELIKAYDVKDLAALVDKYGQAAVDEAIGLLRVEDFILDNATVDEKVTAGDTEGENGDDPSTDGSSAEGEVDEELEAAEATDMVPGE